MEKQKKGVRLEHISKIYNDPKTGKEFYAVQDTTLDIEPGTFVTLLGPSGCGKTTTLRMIAGLRKRSAGVIKVEGERIEDKETVSEKRQYCFPELCIVPTYDGFNNVAYGLTIKKVPKPEIQERVMEMLRLVQLEGFEKRKPDELSGGQKQRLSIARALIRKPEIYIYDDSFSALDFKTDARLRKALKPEIKNAIVFLVAQRVSTILDADKIVVLDEGKIAGIGTHRELLASCPIYYEIAASQLSKEELTYA